MRLYGVTAVAIGFVLVMAYAVQSAPSAAQMPLGDSATLVQLFKEKALKSVEFSEDGWAYHVEAPSPATTYIAGVSGPTTKEQAVAAFSGPTARKAADLLIMACGSQFGDDDCDFFSPLNQVPRSGRAITKSDLATYQGIVKSARTNATKGS